MDSFCQTFVSTLHKCIEQALNNYIYKREAVLLLHQHFTPLPHPFNLKRRTRGIKLYNHTNIIFMVQPRPLFIHFCLIKWKKSTVIGIIFIMMNIITFTCQVCVLNCINGKKLSFRQISWNYGRDKVPNITP